MQRLIDYFTIGITSQTLASVGTEIETQFLDAMRRPITTATSQKILHQLASTQHWHIETHKGTLITSLIDTDDNRILYELGRHNLEVATRPCHVDDVLSVAEHCLAQLYDAAHSCGAHPYHGALLESADDLLVIPDERDATWVELDGRDALMPLARMSAVQFTFSVTHRDAVPLLNRLSRHIDLFLQSYPQDILWRNYIRDSRAHYLPQRYGGPLHFASLEDYCTSLIEHAVVQGTHLTPYHDVDNLDIPLYLRSIWWYFRLKRYGDNLCIEARPFGRGADSKIHKDFTTLLTIINA